MYIVITSSLVPVSCSEGYCNVRVPRRSRRHPRYPISLKCYSVSLHIDAVTVQADADGDKSDVQQVKLELAGYQACCKQLGQELAAKNRELAGQMHPSKSCILQLMLLHIADDPLQASVLGLAKMKGLVSSSTGFCAAASPSCNCECRLIDVDNLSS